MTDLSQLSDRELVLEIYRRIKSEDEMSLFKNYCDRAALRPVFVAFDRVDIDEANVRMFRRPDWKALEAQRDQALASFPE